MIWQWESLLLPIVKEPADHRVTHHDVMQGPAKKAGPVAVSAPAVPKRPPTVTKTPDVPHKRASRKRSERDYPAPHEQPGSSRSRDRYHHSNYHHDRHYDGNRHRHDDGNNDGHQGGSPHRHSRAEPDRCPPVEAGYARHESGISGPPQQVLLARHSQHKWRTVAGPWQ